MKQAANSKRISRTLYGVRELKYHLLALGKALPPRRTLYGVRELKWQSILGSAALAKRRTLYGVRELKCKASAKTGYGMKSHSVWSA